MHRILASGNQRDIWLRQFSNPWSGSTPPIDTDYVMPLVDSHHEWGLYRDRINAPLPFASTTRRFSRWPRVDGRVVGFLVRLTR